MKEDLRSLIGKHQRLFELQLYGTHLTLLMTSDINLKSCISAVDVPVWPAYSPDLNPIEGVWRMLKRALGNRHFETADELWRAIVDAWENIDMAEVRNMLEGMPERMREVIRRRGGYTRY